MTLLSEKHRLPDFRLANFSNLDLSLTYNLKFKPENVQNIVKEIRRYADLPYVYLVPSDHIQLVRDVLTGLKSIRSSCYPYVLFVLGETAIDALATEHPDLDIIACGNLDEISIRKEIDAYASRRFVFDYDSLKISGGHQLPETVDVVIVGAGITGLYAAKILSENHISVCVVEKSDQVGGIWAMYANTTSQVNTSEPAYRLIENKTRTNRDHSFTREILEDIVQVTQAVSGNLYLNTHVEQIEKSNGQYHVRVKRGNDEITVKSTGVLLAINDRVGEPRKVQWKNQDQFQGDVFSGISNENHNYDWTNKRVVVTGMGAFAVENVRTALEHGAEHVTVVCRRHGTVCPKIIDYLNFASPYDENFQHDKKGNMRNMLLWKKLYDSSGATQPECWMGKIKHSGHTISVSDIWFIGHHLKKITTVTGSVTEMNSTGVIINGSQHIAADVVVNCVGFHRNASVAKDICNYSQMYNVNYIDKDFMYLADAFIDDDVFNSFFGSSVMEMAKFYMNVYLKFFNNPDFEAMIQQPGVGKIDIENRSWSHYITGAISLINAYPDLYNHAMDQVTRRTEHFNESFDLETYITANKREWIDTHARLAGKPMNEEACLPYVFEKLIKKTV